MSPSPFPAHTDACASSASSSIEGFDARSDAGSPGSATRSSGTAVREPTPLRAFVADSVLDQPLIDSPTLEPPAPDQADVLGEPFAPAFGAAPSRRPVPFPSVVEPPPPIPLPTLAPSPVVQPPDRPRGRRSGSPRLRALACLRDRRLKRAIDLAGSVALLGALSPVLGVCAAAVRLSSPGPILFRQRRIGRDGRTFEMLKFRTMYENVDQKAHQEYVARLIAGTADRHAADGTAVFKLVGDRRITPIGHWLRRLSLDELPQLLNVLRGDMSLVGPRPPLPYEVEHYTPRHLERLAVTPGITGLWQVSGRSRTTFEEMIDLDLTYIERWSVPLDLQILLRTLPVVIFPDGH
jgi:lipopolysaccharide/colanic/teichoic acid biosynthesis glycosyltransferase